PIDDITHLFEKHGIVVSIIKSDGFSIDACSKWFGNKLFILVGNDRSVPSRIKFTLAHELGHFLLHKSVKKEDFNKKDVYKRMEEEANHFASAFLLPAETISNELVSHTLDYYLLLKRRWQVSMQAMVYRSKELNLINEY
ncbi:ImmA/IrrE family metallo-endopeptidase, partial [Escherichia coli]|nr:ImmA/IrrE family metallo-endopeptidase [Escherichia coli]